MYNPSLRSEPRRQPAAVLPLQRESSILDWLESSGRLIARDVNEAEYLESEEEISELMGVDDSAYEDDDDDDLDLED
jgi:hypothetical protein